MELTVLIPVFQIGNHCGPRILKCQSSIARSRGVGAVVGTCHLAGSLVFLGGGETVCPSVHIWQCLRSLISEC